MRFDARGVLDIVPRPALALLAIIFGGTPLFIIVDIDPKLELSFLRYEERRFCV